jgi:hypothetical protein
MPKNTESTLKQILKFIQNPNQILHSKDYVKLSFFQTFFTVLKIISWTTVVAAILGVLATTLASKLGFSPQDNYLVVNELTKMPIWTSFAFLVILGPFYEELSFRLFLNPKKLSVLVGLFFFTTFLLQVIISLGVIFFYNSYIFSLAVFSPLFYLAIIFVLFITFFMVFFVVPSSAIEPFFSKHLKILLYISAILFGVVHVSNYTNVGSLWWITLLLILPQLLVGFVLPFIRLKFGFWWSVFAHGLYNFIFGFTLLGFLAGPESVRNWVINYGMNPEKMSKLSSFEIGYVNLVSFIGAVIYGVVLLMFLQVIWEYIHPKPIQNT